MERKSSETLAQIIKIHLSVWNPWNTENSEDSCLTLKSCEGVPPGKGFQSFPFYSFSLEHLVHAQQETEARMESLRHLLVSPSSVNLWRSTSAWEQLFWTLDPFGS